MILSEKSATFRDHALACQPAQAHAIGAGRAPLDDRAALVVRHLVAAPINPLPHPVGVDDLYAGAVDIDAVAGLRIDLRCAHRTALSGPVSLGFNAALPVCVTTTVSVTTAV